MPTRGYMADTTLLAAEFSGSGLRTPSVAQTPLSTHLSGAGGLSSDPGGLPKADGSPSDPLTQDWGSDSIHLCSLAFWEKEPLFPPFSFHKNPFSFHKSPFSFELETPQNSSRDQNPAVAGGEQNHTNTRKIPPYGSPNPPRCQVQKVPLRRENRTTALHCCHSANSAETLLFPKKSPPKYLLTRGVWTAGRLLQFPSR